MSIKRIQRKEGTRFQVYGRRDGQKVYVSTHDSLRAAKEADEDYRTARRKIDRGELPPEHDAKRTLGSAAKLWLKALEDSGSPSHGDYARRIDAHVLPTLKDVPLVSIRRADVLAWRDELQQRVSAATVNTIIGTLSSLFSWCIDRDWLAANPCHRVKMLKHEAKVFPWLQSGEAITKLLSELRTNVRTLCAVLVGTGMRLQEALSLKWMDIDIEHRIITVRKTKAHKVRRVPIFDSVLSVLKEMKLARGHNVFLWPGAKRGKPLSQATVWYAFKEAAEMAELPKELRVHDLRHTFASLFLVDGGDIFKLSKILGHSSVAITERTYAHLKPTAYAEDYGRVRFAMPSDGDNVITLAQ